MSCGRAKGSRGDEEKPVPIALLREAENALRFLDAIHKIEGPS